MLLLLFGDTVRIVWIFKLSPSWHLIVSIKRVSYTFGLRAFKQSSRLGTKDSFSVQAIGSHLIWSSSHIGENTESLRWSLSPSDIASLETTTVRGPILGRIRHTSRFAAIDCANLARFAILINDSIGRVERVWASFRFAFDLGHICVIVSCETARILSWLVSLICLGALNVIDFHDISCFAASHHVSLGLGLVNIIDSHGVSDVLGGSHRANLNMRKLVCGVQRVASLPIGNEFVDLRGGSSYIVRFQVRLLLVEANVESAGPWTVNVPVCVTVLHFLCLLGAVQFWGSA